MLLGKFIVICYKMFGEKQNTAMMCVEPQMENILNFNMAQKNVHLHSCGLIFNLSLLAVS